MMEEMMHSMSSSHENEVRKAFKIISYLLQYPDKKWLQWGELKEEVEQLKSTDIRKPLTLFLEEIGNMSLDDLVLHYVNLFDFNSSCTLSLSYLKVGEQRERGQILVELKSMYKDYGFEMIDEELPDFLPVVLEFVAIAPLQISANLLNSFFEPIEKLKSELKAVKSPYAYLIDTCSSGVSLLEKIIILGERG